jgi:hypothetical protein
LAAPWQVKQRMAVGPMPAALDRRLVHAHRFALPGRIVPRMAVEAARMHDHLARFLEERHGALVLVGDAIEARHRREAARRILCERGSDEEEGR